MARVNRSTQSTGRAVTYEGGTAVRHQKPLLELERAVATCLLWENTYYESGNAIGSRIASLCEQVSAEDLAAMAEKARTEYKLRHVPLWLARQMVRLHTGPLVATTVAKVVRRPDEAAELLSLYWKFNDAKTGRAGKRMIPKAMKVGLARAFRKWDAYQLAKWNRDNTVKLRDVLFLIHADPGQETVSPDEAVTIKDPKTKVPTLRARSSSGPGALWKQLVEDTLPTPDTWEVALSAGADKKATWERLLTETTEWGAPKLGVMALLANLRNMTEAQVDQALVERVLVERAPGSWALPFRFVAASKAAPAYAQALSDAMLAALTDQPKLVGHTAVVIDVSGSMKDPIAAKSTLARWEAAAALAVLIREIVTPARVFTFSDKLVEVKNLRGLPLIDAVRDSQEMSGTYLAGSLKALEKHIQTLERVIVITDEQSHDGHHKAWTQKAYLVNVAGYKPALDVSQGWTRISGWSDRLVDFIRAHERLSQNE